MMMFLRTKRWAVVKRGPWCWLVKVFSFRFLDDSTLSFLHLRSQCGGGERRLPRVTGFVVTSWVSSFLSKVETVTKSHTLVQSK